MPDLTQYFDGKPFDANKATKPEPEATATPAQATIEERTIEAILKHRKTGEAIKAGLESEHFSDKTLAALYEGLAESFNRNGEADKLEVIISLRHAGKINEVQANRLMELDDRADHESTGRHVSALVAEVMASSNKRKADYLRQSADRYLADGDATKAAELFIKTADLLRSSKTVSRWDELQKRKFDPDRPVEKTEPVLTARGCPIAARGNLTMLSGEDKSGKSHVLAAMIRAISEGGTHLGIESVECGKVLYLDCEQAAEDFDDLLRTQGNGAETAPDAYCLTGINPAQCRADLNAILEKTPGLSAVLLDGFADLIDDVNDAEQSCGLVAELMALAERHNVAVIGVLHLNPGSESKTRGHLGSQLERKSRTVLSISKSGEDRILFTRKARKKPLPESQGIRFAWSDQAKGFVEIEGTLGEIKQAQKVEDWTRMLYEIQAETGMLAWKHAELKAAIEKAGGIKDRAARGRIKQMLDAGLLKFDASRGVYTSKLENGTDDESL